jgi:MFS family permease
MPIFFPQSRDLRLYLIASGLFGFVLFGGIYPLLYNLYLLRLGYQTEFIGLANATGAFSFALSSLPSGMLGGRWGSRFTMVVGICIAVVGYGLLSQAELVSPIWRDQFILITYSIGVMGIALFVVNGTPYLMAITSPAERAPVFAVQSALMPLSGFVGSLLGGILPGYLADILNISLNHPTVYRYTLFLGALCLIPAFFALLATKDVQIENKQETSSKAPALPLGLIIITALISIFHVAGEAAARTFFNVYMDKDLNISLSFIGLQLAGAQLVAVPAALSLPFLSSRFGIRRTVIAVTAITALLLLLMSTIPNWLAASFCFVCIMSMAALRRSSFAIFHQELVSSRWRTAMSGATSMMSGMGYSAMALGGGYMIPFAGFPSLFLTGSVLTGIGAFLFWIYFRKDKSAGEDSNS